jgi:hypothetical protein
MERGKKGSAVKQQKEEREKRKNHDMNSSQK